MAEIPAGSPSADRRSERTDATSPRTVDARAFVLDTSVVAKWYLTDEPHAERAQAIRDQFIAGELTLVVPDCLFYELTGFVVKAERQGRLSADQADLVVSLLKDLALEHVTSQSLIQGALVLARRTGASAYDAMFLHLAEQRGCTFVTADEKLLAKTGQLPYVKPLEQM